MASFYAFDSAFIGGVYVAAGNLDGLGTAEIVAVPWTPRDDEVRVFNANGTLRNNLTPIPGFPGIITFAVRDVRSIGRADLYVAPGRGGPPQVHHLDGVTLQELDNFFAFDQTFRGGLFVG